MERKLSVYHFMCFEQYLKFIITDWYYLLLKQPVISQMQTTQFTESFSNNINDNTICQQIRYDGDVNVVILFSREPSFSLAVVDENNAMLKTANLRLETQGYLCSV